MSTSSRVEELTKKFDENPRRYFAPLANELRKQGDLAQAIAICRAHLPTQPGHVSGHIVLAQALYEAGEMDEARSEFAAAVELDPENLIALRYMGDIARAGGAIGDACIWYKRVLDADPRNYEIARVLRELESLPNDPEPAETPIDDTEASVEPPRSSDPDAQQSAGESTSDADVPPISHFTMAMDGHEDSGRAAAETDPVPAASPVAPAHEAFGPETDESFFTGGDEDAFTMDATAPTRQEIEPEEAPIDPSELDALWEEDTAPASHLSDYEAAPEQWFEEPEASSSEEDHSSGIAAAGDRRKPMPTGEIEALFDTSEVAGHVAQQQAAEAPVRAEAPHDEVDAAFTPTSPQPNESAGDGEPSVDTLPIPERTDAVAETEPAPLSADATDAARYDESALDSDVNQLVSAEAREELPDVSDPHIGRTPSFTPAVLERAAPFVTETLAELYLQQGFMTEALSIYRQLLARDPSDETLQRRIASLEGGEKTEVASQPAAPQIANEKAAQSVRTFFGRLARRMPSGRSPAATEPRRGEDAQGAGVFSGPSSESDTRAAQNLSSAFSRETSASSARPSRPADRDLSLDHLFREAPPPDAGPVTIDEFYAPPEGVPAAPANGHGADDDRTNDIKQFTKWLEGLKKK